VISWLLLAPLLAQDVTPLRAFLEKAVAEKSVAGVVLMVQKGERVVFREAFGYADLGTQRKMTTSDLFMMASSTKPFSATAVMTLVDAGKLSLDDRVSKFYPSFTGASTVRQLLSHTSGLFGNDGPPEAVKWIRTMDLSVAQSVAGILAQPLAYEPGARYSYGGASFEVAGGIVEQITGQSFEAYMRKVLLDPLGLRETMFHSNRDLSARVPMMYSSKNGELTRVATLTDRAERRGPQVKGFVLVAGGLYSTGNDCLRFLRLHLQNGKGVLSEKAALAMRTKQTGELKQSYGLGWNLQANGAIGHGGAYGTDLWFHPERDLAVALMIQSPAAGAFQQQVRKLVLEIW
jgi:CubicO group peptidase (beta-lactamase class C family)